MSEPQIYEQIAKKMSEKRLNEIKNSINFQVIATKAYEYDETLINEEVELYDEVVRLREENEMLKEAQKNFEKQFIKEMDYKTRNEKAIKCIKRNSRQEEIWFDNKKGEIYQDFIFVCKTDDLLNILEGKSDE